MIGGLGWALGCSSELLRAHGAAAYDAQVAWTLRSTAPGRFQSPSQRRYLHVISVIAYGSSALALLAGAVGDAPGRNPTWVLLLLASALIAAALRAWRRGAAYTVVEAEAVLLVGVGGLVVMTFTTEWTMGALSNGIGFPVLGAYVGWFFTRRGVNGLYVLMLAWLVGVVGQGDRTVTMLAITIVAETVVAVELIRWMVARLHRAASVDALTGVLNRRGVESVGEEWVHWATSTRQPLAVVVIDLDDLRTTNNQLGHEAGDGLLRTASQEWLAAAGRDAIVGRTGGDEFVVLLPGADAVAAGDWIERVKQDATVSWTAGVAQWESGESFADLVRRADQEMYSGKWR